nr:reverse transcriptase domain-containing protein [Tanacetum cinerariifolium]
EDLKGITTRRGNAYPGPTIPTTSSSIVVERETEVIKDTMHPTNNESTEDVQPLVVPTESPILNTDLVVSPIIEHVATPISAPRPNQRPSIPYPSRMQDQKLRDKANDQPLADLCVSINLMPLSMWNKLSLPDLSPTCMTLKLAGRSISRPVGVAEDVIVKVATRKDHFALPFMDQMLERLAGNQYYCFLDGFSGYFKIPIDLKDQEKTTFTGPYEMFACRCMPFGLCNAPGTSQRCIMAIFHDMIEKTIEVFMDDFSVFGNSFQSCIPHLEKMLKRCEDTNLCLNWEKSHFMVKEGIVLGHKISKEGIVVDKAKINVITKLPHLTTVKGIRSFLGHAGFYRRFIKDFSKIARPMTCLLEKDTSFIFSKECVEAFQTLKRKLTEAPILIAPY